MAAVGEKAAEMRLGAIAGSAGWIFVGGIFRNHPAPHCTTRRRRMKEAGFRADSMAHLHREWLRSALRVAAK
jgi:hypothetical protein